MSSFSRFMAACCAALLGLAGNVRKRKSKGMNRDPSFTVLAVKPGTPVVPPLG
jgi:hypothetical protein